tara:strand:+ start:697 stop:1041 length:345 start_codon:yes stop_codon:yes gene_type:complete
MNYSLIEDVWGNNFKENVGSPVPIDKQVIKYEEVNKKIVNKCIKPVVKPEPMKGGKIHKINKPNKKNRKIRKRAMRGGNMFNIPNIGSLEMCIFIGLLLLFIVDSFALLGKKIY